MSNTTHCGFIAIVGVPNVGKSTLLNHLAGAKVSITSSKAQTTRYSVLGVLTEGETQFVFVDTPGFQTRYRSKLNKQMNQTIRDALSDVDVVVWVCVAGKENEYDEDVLKLIPKGKTVVAVINKADAMRDRNQLLPQIERISKLFAFDAIVPVSAEKGWALDELKKVIAAHLPESPWLYPEDELTDRDERFLAAEYLREKCFRLLGDEIPYSIHVVVDSFALEGKLRRINAKIYVEHESQRGVILGHEGSTLKRIASEARQEMERSWGGKVFLSCQVVVRPGWKNDSRNIKL